MESVLTAEISTSNGRKRVVKTVTPRLMHTDFSWDRTVESLNHTGFFLPCDQFRREITVIQRPNNAADPWQGSTLLAARPRVNLDKAKT